jgi:hypothetical protein
VNAVQSTSPQQSWVNKKIKNKPKKKNNHSENTKTPSQPPSPEKQPQ